MELNISWMNLSGIYKISCKDKCYIGSSVDLYGRFAQHISGLKNNKHHSIYMQNSYNKYGEASFTIEIIKILESDIKILRGLELIYIEELKPVFNSTTPVTYEHSTEMCKKIGETLKRRYKSGELKVFDHPTRKVPVSVYNFKDELMGSFSSTKEAIRKIPKLSNATSLKNNLRKGLYCYKDLIVIPNNEDFNRYINKNSQKIPNLPIIRVTEDKVYIIDKKEFGKSITHKINRNKGKIIKVRGRKDLFIHLGYYSKLIDLALNILKTQEKFNIYKTIYWDENGNSSFKIEKTYESGIKKLK